MNKMITIPHYINLSTKNGWDNIEKNKYFVIRFHFYVKEIQLEDKIFNGDFISAHSSPLGVGSTSKIIETIEYEEVEIKSCIINIMEENEIKNNIESTIDTIIGKDTILGLDVKMNNEIGIALKEVFQKEIKMENHYMTKKTKTIEHTIEFSTEEDTTVYSVIPYKKCQYDLYLAYVDYLKVEYKQGLIKQRRRKEPKAQSIRHNNKIVCKLPICSIEFWKVLDYKNDPWIIKNDAYIKEVKDPTATKVKKLTKKNTHIPIPLYTSEGEKTLYRLSTKAFPLNKRERELDIITDNLTHTYNDELGIEKNYIFSFNKG